MSILKLRNRDGTWSIIRTIRGEPGPMPTEYVADASVSSSKLTLTKADGSKVEFAGGGGGGGSSDWNDITNKPEEFPPSAHNHEQSEVKGLVARLTEIMTLINDMVSSATFNALSTVVDRLVGKESIWDGKADASAIPTKTSQLTNDSGYLTQHQSLSAYRTASNQDVIDDALGSRISELEAGVSWSDISDKPGAFPPTSHSHTIADVTNLSTSLSNKVDKVSGKGLSTNDFTTTLKNKLDGIASGAGVNVQSDWNATSGDAYIKNKPTTFPPSSHTHDDRYYTETEVNNLIQGIPSITTSGSWTIIQFANSYKIAIAEITFSNSTFAAAGNLFRSPLKSTTIPSGIFTSAPKVFTSLDGSSTLAGCSFAATSATNIEGYMYKLNSTQATHKINFLCFGK